MNVMKKLALLAMVSTVALGGGSACRGDLTNPGRESPGDFFVEIGGPKDTTVAGSALFYQTVADGTELLSVILVTSGARFQLAFAIRDFDRQIGEHNLSETPDRYSGSYYYGGAADRATFEITGGTISLTRLTKLTLEGEFSFESVATEGPNVGSIGQITGWFRAACDGECVGSGGQPPGS